MNYTVSNSGINYFIDGIKSYIDNVSTNFYVGLMSNKVPVEIDDHVTTGISEISASDCSGYTRLLCSGVSVINDDTNYLRFDSVQYNINYDWKNIYGYFVTIDNTNNVLFSNLLPYDKAGIIPSGNSLTITPIYNLR